VRQRTETRLKPQWNCGTFRLAAGLFRSKFGNEQREARRRTTMGVGKPVVDWLQFEKEALNMKTMHGLALGAVTAAVLFGLGGCGDMSTRDKDTAIGAGAGAVGGAILTGGSGVGTVGGAVVGGVIGNQVGKGKN
jgi:osmotically inducible lipoprotein OsmB